MATQGRKNILGSIYSWVKYSENKVVVRRNGLIVHTMTETQARHYLRV